MSEQGTSPGEPDAVAGSQEGAQEWDEQTQPPVALEGVKSLFVTLGKTFRAFQLYDENNPVRRRFVDQLRTEFGGLWKDLDRLVVTIDEDHMYLEGVEVYQSASRNDSLAFLFFKDGVREITFQPGLETEELDAFLGVLQKARKLVPEGDDLLTVLWEQELQYFQYQYVNLLAEGVELPVPGAGNSQAELQAVLQAEDEEMAAEQKGQEQGAEEEQAAPATVNQDDFNPTLYALDQREMGKVRAELEKELKRDTRADVLNALFDRLEEPNDPERQSTVLRILATLLPNVLSRGALVPATGVLQEVRRLRGVAGVFDEQRRAEAQDILDSISAPEAISELLQALYDGTVRASAAQLGNFLQFLQAEALAPLLKSSETVEHKELQAVLRKAVQSIASQNQSAAVQLMKEEDPIVAAGAARLCGEMQITQASGALADLLAHDDPNVRMAAVEAAVALKASTVAGALERTLDDPERELRIAAARALGALQYRPAAKTLAGMVKSKDIRTADITEKVAVFEAYGIVAEADGLDLLDGLLNGKGFLGKREPTEIRAAAALALGRIPGDGARAMLEKATLDDDPVVRSNVNRALRQETEA